MMKANRVLIICVLAATLCSALTWTSAWGVDYTWNIAGSGDWGTAANWTPAGVPASGDVLLLSNGGTIDLGGSRTVTRVGATGTGNGIVGTLTNGSLHFTNNMYVKSGTVGVNLSNAGGSTGRLWIGGNGAATVVLTGVNTHAYQDNYATIIGHSTTGAAGIVMLGNNNALGGSTNRTDVYSGTLDLNGQNALMQNQIRLMSSNLASLINSNTSADAGTAAEIVMSASNSIGGEGNLSLGGVVSGGGNLTKIGTGMLTLSGANTLTGQITVAAGTLSINSWNTNNTNGPLGNSSSKIVLGSTGSTGTLGFTAVGGGGTARRGIELAAGGTGTVHLAPATGTRNTNYIHIDGANIIGSGAFVVDTSYGGVQTSRFIIVGNAAMTGPITVNPYSELQNNLASAGDNKPFGTGTITVSSNGILTAFRNASDATAILGGLAGSGRVQGESSGVKTFKIGANNDSTEFSGVIQNGSATHVAVTKIGTGTLALSGVNTFSGPLRVEEGVLALSGANTFTGQITVAGGTLSINSWNDLGIAGPLGQSANKVQLNGGTIRYTGDSVGPNKSLHMAGAGTIDAVDAGTVLNLGAAGSNSLTGSGDITKEGLGTLQLAQASVAQGNWSGKLIINAGTVDFFGSDSMPKPASFVPDAVQINDGGTFAFTYSETSPSGSQPNTNIGFQLSGNAGFAITAGTHALQGVIANKPGQTGNLIKTGNGTLVLAGDNTYTGATTVDAGVLLVNGSTHAGSAVTVRTNATLGGTGTVGGAATIQAGGKLATGNSIGTLNFGGPLSLENGAVWDWEYVDNTSGNYDQTVGPQLVLPASGTVTFNIHGMPGHSVFPSDRFTVFTGEVQNFSPDRVALKNYSKWTSWEMSTDGSLVLTADSTISLSTDVLNAGQANPGGWTKRPDGYSNGAGVELVRFIGNSDADPLNVAYTQSGDKTINVAPWVVGGSARGTSQQLQVNGYAVNSPYTTDLNLYLRGEESEYNEGFGAHANWIVTFDLDAIRAEHFAGTHMPFQLTGEFGTWGGISSTGAGDGVIQGAIFLDGVRIDDMDPSIANPPASIRNLDFDLTILSGRYLTFGIFNGATTVWDDGVFKNVNLTMIPEPGSLLMLLAAGAAGLLFRWRRGGSR